MRIKVIGIGGIGGCLLPVLCKFANYFPDSVEIVLVDGDDFEEKNKPRQFFDEFGNKAEVTQKSLENSFLNIHFGCIPEYVALDNIIEVVCEKDIVFLCVDNHATRKLVSDYCQILSDVAVISGGNDFTDGNIQVFVRENRQNITPPLANDRHPEIANPKDKLPNEASCAELFSSEPQLVIMNNIIAAMMLSCFYAYLDGKLNYQEAYVDIITGNCRAVSLAEAGVC